MTTGVGGWGVGSTKMKVKELGETGLYWAISFAPCVENQFYWSTERRSGEQEIALIHQMLREGTDVSRSTQGKGGGEVKERGVQSTH